MNSTQDIIEEIIGKAKYIDANLENNFIFLIFNSYEECEKACYVLCTFYEKNPDLFFHVQYKSNTLVDFSIVDKNTADTFKINNLKWLSKMSYIELTELELMFDSGSKIGELVTLFCCMTDDNNSPTLPEKIKEYHQYRYPPLQTNTMTSTFVTV